MAVPVKTNPSFFSNLLRFVKPFVPIIPQVETPLRTPSLNEKFVWTGLAVLAYLAASHVPLFGIGNSGMENDSQWLKILIASSRGTLMDLGITPVVSASYFMQVFVMCGIIKPNFSIKEDKVLYDCLQKLIAIVLTIAQALVQIITGFYGPYENISKTSCCLIVFQLFVSGIVIILLDELLQKGYGIGNGVNLFIVANVCERIVWNAISPKVFYTGRGLEFEGNLISMVHVLFTRKNKWAAIKEILFRENLPNLFSLLFTLLIFSFVVYIQSVRVEIPLISRKHKGLNSSFPINLLYCSMSPIFLQTTIVSQFFNLSRILYKFYPTKLFVKLLGVWEFKARMGYVPISGLCYYILPPRSYKDIVTRPVFFIIYIMIMLGTSALLSIAFLEGQDESASSTFKKIKNMDMQLRGFRDNNSVERLNEYIIPAAFIGGILTQFVVQFCDLFQVVGSGSNIFLAASIINQYMKLITKETLKKSGKAMIE